MSEPVTRSSKTNILVLLGIVAFLIVVGVFVWVRWNAAAATGQMRASGGSALWGLVVVGGPVCLLVAFVWGKLHNRKASRATDQATPSDDPSKGMTGHD